MIFKVPPLTDKDHALLALINRQRDRLRVYTQSSPRRWLGSLRRSTLARAIQGSNSIEGIHATLENVLAAVENEDPTDIGRETWLSVKGYRDRPPLLSSLLGNTAAMAMARSPNCCARRAGQSTTSGSRVSGNARG